jgi:16S rRNA (cytosine967-C5)-methyltransferase
LEAREAALARAIYRSSVARWNGLMHLIGRHLKRPWRELEPELRGALMAGGAQLLFLEGVAPHAAVHETVAWVKRVNPKASGLVNAVLRRLSEDIAMTDSGPMVREQWTHQRDELPLSRGGALVLNGELLPAPPPERLEVATGVPRWQITQWIEAYGLDQTVAMCAHSLIEPPIVLRTAHAVQAIDQDTGFDASVTADETPKTVLRAHVEPGHHVMIGSPHSMELWLAERPGVWVQDASSSRAIGDNASLTPSFIVDLCAGQGTKTRQLAATFPEARIVATDIDQRRMRTLAAVFADHPKVEVIDAERIGEVCARKADLVLADVPCSNSGVLPRRGEARLRLGENQLRRLVNDQRTVLDQACSLLGRGGMILYATCSLEAAENREQAEWAVKTHGLSLIADRQTLPEGSPGGDPAQYRDGAYWALLGPSSSS